MPAEDNQESTFGYARKIRDWRIGLGLILSFVWLASWVGVAWVNGWDIFWNQELERLGGFEGLFAPLAFLWLVIGLFIQQKELATNTRTLQQSNEHAEEQTRVLEATELRARQTSFFEIATNVSRGAGTLLGYMVSTTLGPDGAGKFTMAELKECWSAHSSGESDRFPFLLLTERINTRELFFANEANTAWSEDLVRSVRSLLKLAHECDDEERTISRAITQSSLGYVYSSILGCLEAPSAWAMFEDIGLFSVKEESVDASGSWHSIESATTQNELVTIDLSYDDANRLNGTVSASIGTAMIDYGAVRGNHVFFRYTMKESPVVVTAVLVDDRLVGSFQWREGLLKNFEATKN